jgi:Glutamine cyclotransferase
MSCSSSSKKNANTSSVVTASEVKLFTISAPSSGNVVRAGEVVPFTIVSESETNPIDSAKLMEGSLVVGTFTKNQAKWNTQDSKMGIQQLRVVAYSGTIVYSQFANLKVLPKDKPVRLNFRIKHTYPHDIGAYTQGLLVYKGDFLEGTGQLGESNLRQVQINTGKVLRQVAIPSEMFGEGITILGDKIYQLTWRSNVCFVYDLNSFRLINRFNYPTEGWGITTIGNQLVMSDGSNILYFMDPEYFTEKSRIEVYDNEGPVHNLNELEYIDGCIWANDYMTNRVVKIDPKTGKVVADVFFSDLLKPSDKKENTDVLNGIAYDSTNHRMYVTGKYWPKLFEVEVY